MTTQFKLKAERMDPDHIRVRIYTGPKDQTLAFNGELVFAPGEYQLLGAALGLGQKLMIDHAQFDFEGVFEQREFPL